MVETNCYAEFLADGHLSIPKETVDILGLRMGEKFRCLYDNENLIILKRLEDSWGQRFGRVSKSIQQDAVEKQLNKVSEEEINQFIKELRLERTKG